MVAYWWNSGEQLIPRASVRFAPEAEIRNYGSAPSGACTFLNSKIRAGGEVTCCSTSTFNGRPSVGAHLWPRLEFKSAKWSL